MEEAGWEAMGGLAAGADVAGRYKLPGVCLKGGPLEAPADEVCCTGGPRVASQPAGVAPLQNLTPERR